MRFAWSVLAMALSSVNICTAAAENVEHTMKRLLLKAKTWTMYTEYTEAIAPSDRASKLTFEFFERDHRLMGRQVGLAFGGCDVEVILRRDGFDLPWCPPYQGERKIHYDPGDQKYPFKSRDPRKIWLQANE